MNNNKINISTELMKNYKQAEIMSPEKKFEALQTSTGCSLLFSIGTDNIFYVTKESVGHDTGWKKTDLSSAQINKSFSGETGLICKTFEASQSVVDGTVGIAMVLHDGKSDHLFLSLGNSNSDTSWVKKPNWIQYPFDNPAKDVTIVNVFISETASNKEYIVVDILRDQNSAEKLISRYYINTRKNGKPAWQPHDVSIDLEANSYTSCLGRQYLSNSRHQPTIDGLYTSGQVDGKAQFTFQPLYNVFDPELPASPARLNLPNNLIADSMDSCRKSDKSTDLYVCSKGGLYYFASSNQNDEATAVLLAQDPIFNGVRKMYANQTDDTVIVWGLNGNDEIFYTSCPVGQELATPTAWSHPLPIVSGVDMFSPYINRQDNGNTFFAASDNKLQKFIKSPKHTIWQSQSIALPTTDNNNTQKYSSYTTRIHVTDQSNQPVSDTPITISSDTRTGVYINHLYHVIDSIGIEVNTDELGSITIVEWINSLTGTKLNISDEKGNVQKLNPMDKPINKLSGLNTVDNLKNASITNSIDGTTKPLVNDTVSKEDLQTVADSNDQLTTIYNKLSTANSAPNNNNLASPSNTNSLIPQSTAMALSFGGLDAISVDAGDLYNFLKTGVDATISIIENAAEDTWHFVAKVAGKVYSSVLDAVDKVVGAFEWIYNKIKTAIQDLILFLEFLLEWKDILTTHSVMKNVFTQWVQHSMDSLSDYKTDIVSAFKTLQNDVDKWADIPNLNQTPNSTRNSNKPLAGQHSAPANLGTHHYQGNVSKSTSSNTPTKVEDGIFTDLLDLLESEEDTLKVAFNAIKTDIIEQFDSLTITEIIKKLVAIIVDTMLQTAENILLAVIDVFILLIEGIMDLITATIDIPVISWLYKEITGDDLTILDLVCLIGAIPTTIIYKTVHGETPFSKSDSFTKGLIEAKNIKQIQGLFFTKSSTESSFTESNSKSSFAKLNSESNLMKSADDSSDDSSTDKKTYDDPGVLDNSRLKTFGFVTGLFALFGTEALIITTSVQRGLEIASESGEIELDEIPDPLLYVFSTVAGLSNIAYVSPNFATLINAESGNWYQQLNNAFTGVSIVKGLSINIYLSTETIPNPKAYFVPAIESLLNFVWNVPVIMNIIDNSDRANSDYKSLIPESIGNFAFNLGGIMEYPIFVSGSLDKEIPERVIQNLLMQTYGICMPVAGGIYQWAHNQDHGTPINKDG